MTDPKPDTYQTVAGVEAGPNVLSGWDGTSRLKGENHIHGMAAPRVNHRYIPHAWEAEQPGAVCKRCGAEWPTEEACP